MPMSRGCATPTVLSGRLSLMTTYANLGRSRSGLGWRVLFKACSEGEKGESRPLKDRLCPGTTPDSWSIQVRRG